MKNILNTLRNHSFLRPMTEETAKSICTGLLRPMVREHELAMKAALEDEHFLAALLHLGLMSIQAIKGSLTKRSLLLHVRLIVGSEQERAAIITGCLDAGFQLMPKPPPPNSPKGPTVH